MKYVIDDKEYNVDITRKNNKNTYIRVKENLTIYVTTSYFVTNKQIIKILDNNNSYLRKAINKQLKVLDKKNKFFYLGHSYDIIYISSIKSVDVDYTHNIIYSKDLTMLNKWLNHQIKELFIERYNVCFQEFKECLKIPRLKIRKMKTRWGVYNRVNHSITLNSHLIEYSIDCLDYVIYHELSHTVHFDHSKSFWSLVGKYCPTYKEIKKKLKE